MKSKKRSSKFDNFKFSPEFGEKDTLTDYGID